MQQADGLEPGKWMASLDDLFVCRRIAGNKQRTRQRWNDGPAGEFNFPALRFVVLSRFRPGQMDGLVRSGKVATVCAGILMSP